MASLMPTSWNRMIVWLRQIDGLQRAAWTFAGTSETWTTRAVYGHTSWATGQRRAAGTFSRSAVAPSRAVCDSFGDRRGLTRQSRRIMRCSRTLTTNLRQAFRQETELFSKAS